MTETPWPMRLRMTDAPKGWQCVKKPEFSTGHQQPGITSGNQPRAGDVTGIFWGSSSGRTTGFDPVNQGSNPCPQTNKKWDCSPALAGVNRLVQ